MVQQLGRYTRTPDLGRTARAVRTLPAERAGIYGELALELHPQRDRLTGQSSQRLGRYGSNGVDVCQLHE